MKEKGLIVEEKIALPVLTGQTDQLTANKTAHCEINNVLITLYDCIDNSSGFYFSKNVNQPANHTDY